MGACVSMDGEAAERRRERKRAAMEAVMAEDKARELLADVPGRMCSNGATRASCAFSKQGRKGTNQDCMLVWEGFTDESTVLCGVFDGHGPNGHHVARKVRDTLPSLLALPLSFLAEEKDAAGGDVAGGGLAAVAEEDDHVLCPDWWEEKLVAACMKMDRQLKAHPTINCVCSGTTAVTALAQGSDLVVGNVGDSRAIIGRRGRDGSWVAEQLTVDLKPNVPGELERIRTCKGRVFALDDEPHVPRVWLPNANTPGLAMARALGDFLLKDYGLSATPQVTHRRLTPEDEFLVLATDGVWDVLSNQEVVEIISSMYPRREEAAKKLVDAAVKQWKMKHPSALVDDCAVVCHFFKGDLGAPIVALEENKSPPTEFKTTQHSHSKHKDLHRGETMRGHVPFDILLGGEKPSLGKYDRGI